MTLPFWGVLSLFLVFLVRLSPSPFRNHSCAIWLIYLSPYFTPFALSIYVISTPISKLHIFPCLPWCYTHIFLSPTVNLVSQLTLHLPSSLVFFSGTLCPVSLVGWPRETVALPKAMQKKWHFSLKSLLDIQDYRGMIQIWKIEFVSGKLSS